MTDNHCSSLKPISFHVDIGDCLTAVVVEIDEQHYDVVAVVVVVIDDDSHYVNGEDGYDYDDDNYNLYSIQPLAVVPMEPVMMMMIVVGHYDGHNPMHWQMY
ncbi:hypothetical protein BLA29_001795 [Euroglyphus maynei]|uniref:Uncharacterized protein n=1 Tax=Euroglyphus maynei TaxID=6958 RepID=A0A1Y3AWD1_EURMA|nr:hypothetical protein BLA29_001795 [Euroglyphus maynei]